MPRDLVDLFDESSLREVLKSDPEFSFSRYLFASKFVEGKSCVLDVGCNNGHGSLILLNAGAGTVTGGDINSKAIEYAKNHYNHEGLDFLCLDAANLPFPDDCFDVVVALEVIEHLPELEQRKCLSECRRVPRSSRVIICSTPNKEVYSITRIKRSLNRSHMKEYYIQEFYDLLSEYFVDVTLYGQSFMNSIEIIRHKLVMLAQFVGGGFLSLFPKADEIKHVIYRVITYNWLRCQALFKKDKAYPNIGQKFNILPLSDQLSKPPFDVIAVARVAKKEPKVSI